MRVLRAYFMVPEQRVQPFQPFIDIACRFRRSILPNDQEPLLIGDGTDRVPLRRIVQEVEFLQCHPA